MPKVIQTFPVRSEVMNTISINLTVKDRESKVFNVDTFLNREREREDV